MVVVVVVEVALVVVVASVDDAVESVFVHPPNTATSRRSRAPVRIEFFLLITNPVTFCALVSL
jgi:hypothetical protein